MEKKIALIKNDKYYYPSNAPFHPSIAYPEQLFKYVSTEQNHIYEMVREALKYMGYDEDNFNTKDWNPLKHIVKPGDKVVIKPNLVMDNNPSGDGTDCLFTHPSVIRAITDYVLIALNGDGEIIIGDAPMQSCDFDKLIKESGYDKLVEFYNEIQSEVEIRIKDFRDLTSVEKNGLLIQNVSGNTGIVIDLNNESEFSEVNTKSIQKMRVTCYDPKILQMHHTNEKHEYCINPDILSCDVLINVPKPKTHRKAGVTIALKNLVGINARKEYLPHHTNGSYQYGGDEYKKASFLKSINNVCLDIINHNVQNGKHIWMCKLLRWIVNIINGVIYKCEKNVVMEGNWYGNETISKTIVDLNKIMFYANKDGVLCDTIQRRNLILADMVLAGEKEGPVEPSKKECGMIAIGENPVEFDETIAWLMGADVEKIPTIIQAKTSKSKYKLIKDNRKSIVISNDIKYADKTIEEIDKNDRLFFVPTSGWKEVFSSKLSS